MYFIYILLCADGTLYTGITTDVVRRVAEHNGEQKGALGARYTRGRRPVKLVYSRPYDNRGEATREELRIKKLPKAKKLQLL